MIWRTQGQTEKFEGEVLNLSTSHHVCSSTKIQRTWVFVLMGDGDENMLGVGMYACNGGWVLAYEKYIS